MQTLTLSRILKLFSKTFLHNIRETGLGNYVADVYTFLETFFMIDDVDACLFYTVNSPPKTKKNT